MKKLYLLAAVCISLTAKSQSIPNGNFEQWNSGSYEIPMGINQNSNPTSFFRSNLPFNCTKTTDADHGTYALKLVTVANATDTSFGYAINANPNNGGGNPCQWMGGAPYSQKPSGVTGYYKSDVQVGDSAGVLFAFKKNGVCLGTYLHKFAGLHSTYTKFSISFSLSATPDSMIFAAVSSDAFANIQKAGSMLQLDSLTFTGGVSQPALSSFDGDFENWQTINVNTPKDWYIQTDDQGNGIFRTTDAAKGMYAMELKSFPGNNNNHPVTQSAGVATDYSICPKHGSGMCIQKGGDPFTNLVDTLAFYYKYAPASANDSGQVNLSFTKNGSPIGGMTYYLGTSSSYKYVEMPFNLIGTPDSVTVNVQSTLWKDTLAPSAGSDLKIDEIHFKSQPLNTGIQNIQNSSKVSIFPNPSSEGTFTIAHLNATDVIRVFNVLGAEVNADVNKGTTTATVKIASAGIYFLEVSTKTQRYTEKVIVQ